MRKQETKRVVCILLALLMVIGVFIERPYYVSAAEQKAAIKLNQTKRTIYVGEYTTVKVVEVTGLKSAEVTFKSNNKKIATVTADGLVQAKKKGTAVITVTSKENKSVKAKFTVTVKKGADNPRVLSKIDFDITSLSDGGLYDDNGKLYTNCIDFLKVYDDFEAYCIARENHSKDYMTPRGIKIGSSKTLVLEKYSESSREQAYKYSSFRKAHMEMLERNIDEPITDYITYRVYYKKHWHSIEFIFGEKDTVIDIWLQ